MTQLENTTDDQATGLVAYLVATRKALWARDHSHMPNRLYVHPLTMPTLLLARDSGGTYVAFAAEHNITVFGALVIEVDDPRYALPVWGYAA